MDEVSEFAELVAAEALSDLGRMRRKVTDPMTETCQKRTLRPDLPRDM
jgi:hypothetical protein